MAHHEEDEILKELVDRFLNSETSDFHSVDKRTTKQGLDTTDWRDSTGPSFVTQSMPRQAEAPYTAPGLSVSVSQWIRKNQHEELWNSVIIRCDEEMDGTMTVRVIVSNPEWERQLQIACIRSRPGDKESLISLACNLDHQEVP